MGFLANTAQQAAGASTGWGTVATGVNALSAITTGYGGMQQGNFASKVANQNAEATRQAGSYEEGVHKAATTRLVSEQRAAQAANGIEVGSKSAQAVRTSTENVGALDAAMVHYNAMRAAYGQELEGKYAKKAGRGALSRGLAGAATSLLGGASALSDKAAAFRQSGAR